VTNQNCPDIGHVPRGSRSWGSTYVSTLGVNYTSFDFWFELFGSCGNANQFGNGFNMSFAPVPGSPSGLVGKFIIAQTWDECTTATQVTTGSNDVVTAIINERLSLFISLSSNSFSSSSSQGNFNPFPPAYTTTITKSGVVSYYTATDSNGNAQATDTTASFFEDFSSPYIPPLIGIKIAVW
jgi:hypothetical protein